MNVTAVDLSPWQLPCMLVSKLSKTHWIAFFFFASIPEINTEVQHALMGTFFSSVVLRMSSKRSIDKPINLISKVFPSPLKLNDPLYFLLKKLFPFKRPMTIYEDAKRLCWGSYMFLLVFYTSKCAMYFIHSTLLLNKRHLLSLFSLRKSPWFWFEKESRPPPL